MLCQLLAHPPNTFASEKNKRIMKRNKKRLNRQKADRRKFAEAYRKALVRRRKENKLWDRHRPHKSCGEYDEFRYLRVKDINKVNPIEYWNVENATVVFVVPRLRALIEGMERCGATPGSYYDIDEDGNFVKGGMRSAMEGCVDLPDNKDVDSTWMGWHKVLKKIQYAFDTLEVNTHGCHSSLTDGLTDEQLKKVNEGLLLFAKNFFYLWY